MTQRSRVIQTRRNGRTYAAHLAFQFGDRAVDVALISHIACSHRHMRRSTRIRCFLGDGLHLG